MSGIVFSRSSVGKSEPTNIRSIQRWDRLRPVSEDILNSIGLPSKGDKTLLSFKTQEEYFTVLVDRYDKYCHSNAQGVTFDKAFSTLSLDGQSPVTSENRKSLKLHEENQAPSSNELSTILVAMRKMREAIVASARMDAFSLKAYIFIIRATILMRHMESYHPALIHLLHRMHLMAPLTALEHHEFVGYHILDLACRQDNLGAALSAKNYYKYDDHITGSIIQSIVHGNWFNYWRVESLADVYRKSLMGWREESMRTHTAKCLSRSYLSVDKAYLEQSLRQKWDNFKIDNDTTWQLNEDMITIRKIKSRQLIEQHV